MLGLVGKTGLVKSVMTEECIGDMDGGCVSSECKGAEVGAKLFHGSVGAVTRGLGVYCEQSVRCSL